MPELAVNGTRLYYEDSGGDGVPVVFSHGLLFSGRMFAPQVAALAPRRCVTYDHRGQGRSAMPRVRCIDMETLTDDALALLDAVGASPCHFVGLSMGGFVGMRIAARHPERLRSLTLLETTADPEPAENVPRYRRMSRMARLFGVRSVAARVMPILIARSVLADPARADDVAAWRAELLRNRRSIHRAVCGVLERAPVADELSRVTTPTLVLVGEEDVATPPCRSERIRERIRGARLERIAGAGHSSSLEQPAAVSALIGQFIDTVEAEAGG